MDQIYREELMEHYRNPQNRGRLSNATVSVVEKNPMCGDILTLQVKVDSSGVIEDIKFEADACAVCIAGASVLTEEIKGKTVDMAKDYDKDTLLNELGANLTTSRIKCATLSLEALGELIEKYEQTKTS